MGAKVQFGLFDAFCTGSFPLRLYGSSRYDWEQCKREVTGIQTVQSRGEKTRQQLSTLEVGVQAPRDGRAARVRTLKKCAKNNSQKQSPGNKSPRYRSRASDCLLQQASQIVRRSTSEISHYHLSLRHMHLYRTGRKKMHGKKMKSENPLCLLTSQNPEIRPTNACSDSPVMRSVTVGGRDGSRRRRHPDVAPHTPRDDVMLQKGIQLVRTGTVL